MAARPVRTNQGVGWARTPNLSAIDPERVKSTAVSSAENEEDLTRKQRREQARAERKAMEEASASDAARRKRLTRLGVVVAVVVAAVVVILIATSSGSTRLPKAHTKAANAVETEVNHLLAGIPQSGNSLGSPTAPVTLQYFGDLECPICRKFTLGALPPLIQHRVREGKLRIEYHNLETATREPETFKTQQAAALAAGKQAKAVELHRDLLPRAGR